MILSSLLVGWLSLWGAAHALGQQHVVAFNTSPGSLKLAGPGTPAGTIVLDSADWPAVLRAAGDLAVDFGRVTGTSLTKTVINGSSTSSGLAAVSNKGPVIIAGTIGNSSLIDSLVQSGKIDVSATEGKWEAFQTEIVDNPFPGISRALVVSGSDRRGTVYGLYDISEQIGVSPWYWFADVAPAQHEEIYALNTKKIQGSPSVKYRGLFINDEAPALTNWINANYPPARYGPGFNADFYAHVFELLLRLRANYLWPAEWSNIFALDDPRSFPTADLYGIVIGTSHTEPLMRWTLEQSLLLQGPWNWLTNEKNIYQFLKEGVERSKDYEVIYTMGMRGLGDTASPTINATTLAQIVAAEEQILSEVFNTSNISSIPQMWCLYKEVGGYYEDGLRVADDITLLWADDNWGNIERLPVGNETARSGGAGVYYHFDYVGDPQDYKWINTISLQKTWEQMHLAYERQARKIWIVNVGDLKGLEIPTNHFFDLAYDTPSWSDPDSTSRWLTLWATREFGAAVARKVADIVNRYGQYAARRKFEMITPGTFSIINYNEADNVVSQWESLVHDARDVYRGLSEAARPAFFELVLQPCMAGHIVTQIHVTAAKNNLYASQRRTSAQVMADKALKLFQEDHDLTVAYHKLLDGKWNHIMDQTHLGYLYWQQPMRNTLPPLQYTQLLEDSLAGPMGVSVEGSNASVPGDDQYHALSSTTLALPPLDPYGPSTRWIEIYSRSTESFEFQVSPNVSWVTATPSSGTVHVSGNGSTTDVRVQLAVDWDQAPIGSSLVSINITIPTGSFPTGKYGNSAMPTVQLPVNKTVVPASFHGFVESDGVVSVEAPHASRNTSTANVSYAVIPGYGRTLSGITLLPVNAASQKAPSSPRLEYDVYLFSPVDHGSTFNITLYLGPSLNVNPDRPLRYALSFDDDEPKVVQYVPSTVLGTYPPDWSSAVSNNVWTSKTSYTIKSNRTGAAAAAAGTGSAHTLKLWALEPGVVFEKIVVDLGGVRESYLGPPESRIV